MGRGRAKAKQTKVARALKYSTPNTNFSALEQELHGTTDRWDSNKSSETTVEDDDNYDDYGRWSSAGR